VYLLAQTYEDAAIHQFSLFAGMNIPVKGVSSAVASCSPLQFSRRSENGATFAKNVTTRNAAVKGVDRSEWKVVGEFDVVLTRVVKEIPTILSSSEQSFSIQAILTGQT
jgi:hypothetical protein